MATSNYDIVVNNLGKVSADAIRGMAREEAEDILAANRAELLELAERVRTMHAEHGSAPEVKEAAQVVSDATKAHNAEADKPAPSEDLDTERVQQARQVVQRAESDLAEIVQRHEDEIYGPDRGILVRLDCLEESHSSLQTAVARAIAIARSGEGNALRLASGVALMVFGIVGAIYALVWWLSPLDYQFLVNIGLALGAGGLAGWVTMWWSSLRSESSASANAEAQTNTNDGNQSPVAPEEGEMVRVIPWAGPRSAATAGAQAGRGQSAAGANASVR